jgi:hypothetical protein
MTVDLNRTRRDHMKNGKRKVSQILAGLVLFISVVSIPGSSAAFIPIYCGYKYEGGVKKCLKVKIMNLFWCTCQPGTVE